MSASLVGSEMCIRDSSSPGRRPSWPLGSSSCRRARPRRPTSSLRRRTPVSYTHLTLPTICSV
eukprot:9778167-Alexandrium_andersonii.AAC.1